MTSKTAWIAGSTYTMTYQSAFQNTDWVSLANGNCVLSSTIFDFTDGTYQFIDISVVLPLTASETLINGAGFALWWAWLQGDAATYGDGALTAGSQVTYVPVLDPLPGIQAVPRASVTTVAGDTGLITVRPRKGALILANQTGFALSATAGSGGVWLSAYRQNLNS